MLIPRFIWRALFAVGVIPRDPCCWYMHAATCPQIRAYI